MQTQPPEISNFRLSPQQEQLLSLHEAPALTQSAVVLREPLAAADVSRLLETLVARHEILRTTFLQPAGMRMRQQAIHEALPPLVSEAASSGSPLEAALNDEAAALDLALGPVLRAALVPGADGRLALLLTAPAACLDAQSMVLLLAEIAQLHGGDDTLPESPLQYADYAEWRNQLLAGEEPSPEAARAFWARASTQGRPPTLLFARSSGPEATLPRKLALPLAHAHGETVRAGAALAGVNEDIFLEACWHALVARLVETRDLVLTRLEDGRSQPDLAGAIGPYAQYVPVGTHYDENTTFAEVIDQVRRSRSEAARWQDHGSAGDLAELAATAAIGFAFTDVALDSELYASSDFESLTRHGALALELAVRSTGHGIAGDLVYDPSRYDLPDVEEISVAFLTLVASAAANPDELVTGLAVLTQGESARAIELAAGPSVELPTTPIHFRFEDCAAATPDRPAVASEAETLTFGEANAAANRIAHWLREFGIGRNDRVALCMDRSPAAIVGLLGILKAGAAYVPLNYEHPAARLAHMLAEADVVAMVTQEPLLSHLPTFAGPVVCVDRDEAHLSTFSGSDPERVSEPDDLVYVMYTSGSTGLPKGVAVDHRNLANYTAYMVDRLGAADGLQFAVVSALSTDLGNTAIFPALAAGGCVHLIGPAVAMNVAAFAAYAERAPIDVLKITPSHLGALIGDVGGAAILPRRWLVCGGEALTFELLARVRALSPACRILNHYGPTETTVGSCVLEPGEETSSGSAAVPIGRPIANTRAYVLGANLEPLHVGVAGELCIAGAGVTRGYVGRLEETAERFVADPFGAGPAERMYRTGDRARYLRNGNIEFLGRVDQQAKIRGFRVEPGEIEATLQRHPAVRQAAVVVHGDQEDARLVAYVVAAPQPEAGELRSFLSEWLPEYMLPRMIVPMAMLPLTPSGKVDRNALPDPAHQELQRDEAFVAPRNATEEEIAALWQELLGVERVGVNDDFFALGGHSLLATQMITRIRRRHGDIPLQALFTAPTVAALAEIVQSAST